jgi:hypothetical protein
MTMRKIIEKLASSLGRKDDVPNQELAKEIASKNDKTAINELLEILKENNDKKIQSDCIKTLYEIGYIKPELIAEHYDFFIELLKNKNNRLVWGAMIALKIISEVKPKEIFENLPVILEVTEKGSVISNDNGVGILINLAKKQELYDDVFPLLMEQLTKCVPKQLPMYAERALSVIKEKDEFITLLNGRLSEFEKESQIKRIEKVIKKLNK